jgi:hypothetical protein
LENVLKIFKCNLHNNTGRFSLAAGDDEIHFSAELVEEFSKWVQGFFLFCHLIFLPNICGGPILFQFCHTPLQESTENSGTHRTKNVSLLCTRSENVPVANQMHHCPKTLVRTKQKHNEN